ncbi:hypothetical protein [Streptomyces tibetensis]|uniref:Uncharacterized protein n=1 Tax=Streptomyces tibetensis TaxID=2382123 RepID=A0ABW6N3N2_9ACTN
MSEATAKASSAAPAPTARTTLNPSWDGRGVLPRSVVLCARITPATALAVDVPMDRISVFRLFAAPVSEAGTAPMMSAGIEP